VLGEEKSTASTFSPIAAIRSWNIVFSWSAKAMNSARAEIVVMPALRLLDRGVQHPCPDSESFSR